MSDQQAESHDIKDRSHETGEEHHHHHHHHGHHHHDDESHHTHQPQDPSKVEKHWNGNLPHDGVFVKYECTAKCSNQTDAYFSWVSEYHDHGDLATAGNDFGGFTEGNLLGQWSGRAAAMAGTGGIAVYKVTGFPGLYGDHWIVFYAYIPWWKSDNWVAAKLVSGTAPSADNALFYELEGIAKPDIFTLTIAGDYKLKANIGNTDVSTANFTISRSAGLED